MNISPRILLVLSAVLAASGQLLLRIGAAGATSVLAYLNSRLLLGLFLYAGSTVLWILALSALPLSKVYPFTALTFLLVYIGSALFLGEHLTPTVVGGAGLVLAGLVVITIA